MQENLQENVRNIQKQAEAELAHAAEQDRGAQAASSMQRELRNREGPDPLEELHSQVTPLLLTFCILTWQVYPAHKTRHTTLFSSCQMSSLSTKALSMLMSVTPMRSHFWNLWASVSKCPYVEEVGYPAQGNMQGRPGSGRQGKQVKGQSKTGRQKGAELKRRPSSPGERRIHAPAEDTAETHGET